MLTRVSGRLKVTGITPQNNSCSEVSLFVLVTYKVVVLNLRSIHTDSRTNEEEMKIYLLPDPPTHTHTAQYFQIAKTYLIVVNDNVFVSVH